MNKFIKCWVFILCILFILLILFTDRVNAEEYRFGKWTNISGSSTSATITLNNDINKWEYVFTNTSGLNYLTGYNYISGNFYGYYTSVNQSYNINLQETCNNTSWITQPYLATITYADGSQAQIVYSDYEEMCSQYAINNGTISTDIKPSDINITAQIVYNSGLNYYNCEMNNYNFKCPLFTNMNVNKIIFTISKTNPTTTNFKIGFLSDFLAIKTDMQNIQTIISNQSTQQHQDNQAIIQEQQNINNSITSDNVTGNNSNSSITTIGNTFNTQGDFLLNLLTIPYNLWTSILNAIGGTCSPIDVGTIFGEHLVFPCINLNSLLGGVWTTIIDVIFTGMIYSAFIRRVIKYFRELLTLDPQALETGGVKVW